MGEDAKISAVASLRQKDGAQSMICINNMIACQLACQEGEVKWPVGEELFDLYSIYYMCKGEFPDTLQSMFELTDDEALGLRETVESGNFRLEEEEEEEALF